MAGAIGWDIVLMAMCAVIIAPVAFMTSILSEARQDGRLRVFFAAGLIAAALCILVLSIAGDVPVLRVNIVITVASLLAAFTYWFIAWGAFKPAAAQRSGEEAKP